METHILPFSSLNSSLFAASVAWTFLFVASGYLYHRQPWQHRRAMATTVSDKIYRFCTSSASVSSELAKKPSKQPIHICETLYGSQHVSITEHKPTHSRKPASQADLQRARDCGNWGDSEPSELFLQCFHDALCSLEHDPLAGMASPSLMGSNGVLPITIIAPVPDICRHMANLIVRAEKEVFLATNFWLYSGASRLIAGALLELSNRAGERGERVVVKIMYDRGNIKQVVENHQIMSVKQYTAPAVRLPSPEEIPNVDMEVQNFHRPMLGTFHSKFMVVDRKVAIVQSNNIQDNDNMEMMTHIEGDIVNSVYDTALLSWARALNPPLPCLDSPARSANVQTFCDPSFVNLFHSNGNQQVPKEPLRNEHHERENHQSALPDQVDVTHDTDIGAEVEHMQTMLSPQNGETRMNAVTKHLSESLQAPLH
jgi:phosphatidylserine/phosphatidylglycerophosphate/cardiolipin synthase-like enzyme